MGGAGRAAAGGEATKLTLFRLYLIRIPYILLLLPGTMIVTRSLVGHAPRERGIFASMIAAIFFLAFLVIRYPTRMLPILVLETVWKLIWLSCFGVPHWLAAP